MRFQHEAQRKTCIAIYNQTKPKGQPVLCCLIHVLSSILSPQKNVPKTLKTCLRDSSKRKKGPFKYIMTKLLLSKESKKSFLYILILEIITLPFFGMGRDTEGGIGVGKGVLVKGGILLYD